MDELPVGRRIAYWRTRRRMSQQALADTLGKSKSWVDKVERGVRRLDKLSNLQEIAGVLRIDVQFLIGTEPASSGSGAAEGGPLSDRDLDALRTAMFRHDATMARPDCTRPPRVEAELDRSVEHAWLAYQHADYRQLLRILPGLLHDTQLARVARPNNARTHHLLGQVHQLTSALLGKVGETGMAWLAADRALTICQDAGDESLAALAASQFARVLHSLGRHRHSMEVADAIATRLAPPDPPGTPPEHLPGYGALLLQAATGAAGCGDQDTVRRFLDRADEAATLMGEDRSQHWATFGPVAVSLTRITTALDLDDHAYALALHRQVVGSVAFQRLPMERRAAHLIDVACRCVRLGELPEAGRALLLADRTAPSEVRHRPAARDALRILVRRSARPAPEIARLAETLRLPV
ncbi:XRE family transcriptional regulator [Micromonospora sp. ATCC 39149]|uniref:Helix-turn-helix transcriptional regulator n=1 Tax=Micromonospora carbonacea TaxID=47853 RepID=A0A7D5YDM0_9ACTN|nr:helix-turn-helix domain-containing protein [Micromonospora sp. ATCC 39149]EEP71048.1 XRE family transcriptional regulator [Micromonospora sp. ATCC 39149]QLJ97375.1 helix-turn-helix transcriptional regulator [Micromonospora carbonacea]